MSQQLINCGPPYNTGTGDAGGPAFTKVNSNFTELYGGGVNANTLTNAKFVQAPATTIKGNNAGVTANVTDLTPAQVAAILPTVTSGSNGLAPASGGGTTNFLRADGTWATPPGGGGSTSTFTTLTGGSAAGGGVVTNAVITTGTAVDAAGPTLTISTPDNTVNSASGAAGAITVTGGKNTAYTGALAGPNWTWTASGGSATGTGSLWEITAGPGGTTSGTGGSLRLRGGSTSGSATSGNGGTLILAGGNASSPSGGGSGGLVNIAGGSSLSTTGTGAGGALQLAGGSSISSSGGSASLRGGNTTGASAQGGSLTLSGGNSSGAGGVAGSVAIQGGIGPSSTRGNISISGDLISVSSISGAGLSGLNSSGSGYTPVYFAAFDGNTGVVYEPGTGYSLGVTPGTISIVYNAATYAALTIDLPTAFINGDPISNWNYANATIKFMAANTVTAVSFTGSAVLVNAPTTLVANRIYTASYVTYDIINDTPLATPFWLFY